MKKICFIYAGGTIGMRATKDGVLVPVGSDADFRNTLLPVVEQWAGGANITVEYRFLTAKDSTNMSPDDWSGLITQIRALQTEGFAAVAIVHGTDTMAYTATAIALGMHGDSDTASGLSIPVVLTGAQNSIHVFGGDSVFNLQNLFRTIDSCLKHNVADVVINFSHQVLLGCRALKVSERSFNAFDSPSEAGRVGYIDAYGVHLRAERLAKKPSTLGEIRPKFEKGVVVLDISPGTEPEILRAMLKVSGVKAVILKTPGEGNVCTEGDYSLLPFIETAVSKYKIPILIASKFAAGAVGRGDYEGGRRALDAGAIACFDTTDCAVEVKVRWLLGNGIARDTDSLRSAMAKSFVGEVTPPKQL